MSEGWIAGKTCLITGATAGIGLEAAATLAAREAHVVLVGRSDQRCRAAAEMVRTRSGRPHVEYILGDLSSQDSVRRVAGEFLSRHDRLHVLINNAGALFAHRQESVDGVEMTLALNHLGPFLLSRLLTPALRAAAPARIVNVSSDSHEVAGWFDFDDPEARYRGRSFLRYGRSEVSSLLAAVLAPRHHPGYRQYAASKLANLLFTYELARRLEGTGVTVNALHPGFVATNFTSGNGAYGWFMRRGATLFGRSVEKGAETLVYLASSPDVRDASGRYFVDMREVPSSPASRDREAAARLWGWSAARTGRACEDE